MKNLIAAVVAVVASVALANTYVPVEFILSDGYAYLDTGIPGNAVKVQQKARLQFLAIPGSTTAVGVFGSYANGLTSSTSCALTITSKEVQPNYTGSTSSGYCFGAATVNGFHDYYLHHGYAQDYGSSVACDKATGTGYNWYQRTSLVDQELPTLLLGNVQKDDGELHTAVGSAMPIRWYSYEAIDHETGASLCKLTPAKCVETGLFGMLDAVSGKFITSEVEGHPILGPNYVGGAGKDAGYEPNDIIRVSGDTKVTVGSGDVATINTTGGILVEDAASVFAFSNVNASVSLYAPFFGKGQIRHEYGAADKVLSLYADNRGIDGSISIIEARAELRNHYCLGTTNRVDYCVTSGSRLLDSQISGTISNEFHFGGSAATSARFVQSASAPLILAGPTYFDFKASMTLHGANGGSDGGIRLAGPVTNMTDSTNTKTYEINISSAVAFTGNNDRYLGRSYIKSQGTVLADGKLHFASRGYGGSNNPQDYGQFGAGNGSAVKFLSPYVLDEDVILLMGWSYISDLAPSGSIYLNGYDQQVGRLIAGVKANGYSADIRPQAVNLKIDSPTNAPAKLVIRNTAVLGHYPLPGYLPGCWPGRVNGAASVEINTATDIETAGKISFTCAGSDTTGGLYARRGTIKIYETASFTNLTELVASGEGLLEVLTSAVGGDDLCVALTNVAAGTIPLTIGEGCSITARTAVTRSAENPKWLEPGVYTKDNLPLCLAGDGELVVKEYGGPKGMLLIIR